MRPLVALAGLAFAAQAQVTITGLRIHADSGLRIRPFETTVLQLRVDGEIARGEDKKDTGRVLRAGTFRVVTPDGGWLSKPFKYQGEDKETFLQEKQTSWGSIFQSLSQQFVVQDSVLYTAPGKPGEYEVQASLDDRKAAVRIQVDAEAPSQRKEKVSFGPEKSALDRYRTLAGHWAPVLAQETWFQPKSDFAARFDFDQDWNGDNNWENLETGSSQAFVYYAAMETETHWFLIYNVFHPRDYSDKCVAGTCHENDNEGLILTVLKDGSEYGRLQVMETLAHNNVYSFTADPRVVKGVHNIDGRVEFQMGRPVVFIESGGHGIYGTQSRSSRYRTDTKTFTAGTGVTYVYKGAAERPRHSNDRDVGYELLPILEEWWPKACQSSGWAARTFDSFFSYLPAGGRPRAACAPLGGAFLGRTESSNKAKPFWGWHDTATKKKKILGDGQWALDPAYAVSRNLTFPRDIPFSLNYTWNPFLGIGGEGKH